jgi:hypothetical protein
MSYMPFNDDNQPLYADENENILLRVKDLKKLIEDDVHLSVIDLKSMSVNSDPEKLQELYPALMPDRVWFVWATFQAPEGLKTSRAFVMLKDGQLSLPLGMFLHLETFLAAHRKQAKRDIPDLTLDYIETLESIIADDWRFWRDFVYFLDRHHAQLFVQGTLKPQFERQIVDLYKNFRSVNFFSTENEAIDPFPGGKFSFVEKRDIERKKEE